MTSPSTRTAPGVVVKPPETLERVIEFAILAGGAAIVLALIIFIVPRAWWMLAFAAACLCVFAIAAAIRRSNSRTMEQLERLRSIRGLKVGCSRSSFGLLDHPFASGTCGSLTLKANTAASAGRQAASTYLDFCSANGRCKPAAAFAEHFKKHGLTIRPFAGGGFQVNALLNDPKLVDTLIALERGQPD